MLNAAGPYRQTAAPMIRACLRTGTDYVDLTGEWPVFAAAMAQAPAAHSEGVMLLPGAGVAITITDCLLAMAANDMPDAVRLRLGISRAHQLSRGSVETMLGLADGRALIRREGVIQSLPAGRLAHDFDFGDGRRRAVSFSWPDVVTGAVHDRRGEYRSLLRDRLGGPHGLPDQRRPPRRSRAEPPQRAAAMWPQRPPRRSLDAAGYSIVAEAEDRWRRRAALRLSIRDGYSTTTEAASAIVRRVLAGDRRPGFQTPGKLFGGRFLLELGHATLEPAAT